MSVYANEVVLAVCWFPFVASVCIWKTLTSCTTCVVE